MQIIILMKCVTNENIDITIINYTLSLKIVRGKKSPHFHSPAFVSLLASATALRPVGLSDDSTDSGVL